jgi:hypothetical protein
MWYTNVQTATAQAAIRFIGDVLNLFSNTLATLWGDPLFSLFLAVAVFSAVYALARGLFNTSKGKL